MQSQALYIVLKTIYMINVCLDFKYGIKSCTKVKKKKKKEVSGLPLYM